MSQADVDDTKVTPLRPAQRVERPSANALRQRKFRKKQKRQSVTPGVTPLPTVTPSTVALVPSAPVTVPAAQTPRNGITVAILMAALSLATVSAGFSITGMTSIFVASFWPVIAMGVALEFGKLSAVA